MIAFGLFFALVMEQFVTAKGQVVDSEGAAISKARIIYQRDLAGELMAPNFEDHGVSEGSIETDKSGHYLAKVHPGIYDVCVIAMAFTPQCKKIEVLTDNPSFPEFHLHADPIVTKRLKDLLQESPQQQNHQ